MKAISLRKVLCHHTGQFVGNVAVGLQDLVDLCVNFREIFFVPEDARWSKIASAAHTPEIGTVIDDAMRAIEKENTTLKNVLPKNYASPDLDKRVLGEVVDLFTNMDMGDTEESKDSWLLAFSNR